MRDEVVVFLVQDAGCSRVVVLRSHYRKYDRKFFEHHMVLVCQEINQGKVFYSDLKEEADMLVDLRPLRVYMSGCKSRLMLEDVSRFYNDFFVTLGVAGVVPLHFFREWQECSDELIQPMNELTQKVCADGLNQGLDTKTIMLRLEQAQDNINFVPSMEFIQYSKSALAFVDAALYLDQPNEQIMPYCLIPVPYCSEDANDESVLVAD